MTAPTPVHRRTALRFAPAPSQAEQADHRRCPRIRRPLRWPCLRATCRRVRTAGLRLQSAFLALAWVILVAPAAKAQTETVDVSFSVGADDRVRIEVPSSADRYHVLYYQSDPQDATTERAVAIHMGTAGQLELSEPARVGSAGTYRVATYLKTAPADTDGDGVDDLAELARDGVHLRAPLNAASTLDGDGNEFTLRRGAVAVPDFETFLTLSSENAAPELTKGLLYASKFFIIDADDREDAHTIFLNVNHERRHWQYWRNVLRRSRSEYYSSSVLKGDLLYFPHLTSPAGTPGTFVYKFFSRHWPFWQVALAHEVLTANMPFLRNNLVHYPWGPERYFQEKALYDASRIPVYLDADIDGNTVFAALNAGVGYGLLGVFHPGERPTFRDVAILPHLPNELPTVAGVISLDRQTPLAHVNLRAVQDGVPNAWIRDALEDPAVTGLVGRYVRYEVTAGAEVGYTLAEATAAEVEAHHAARRPETAQTPPRDLTVTAYADIDDIGFADSDAYGAKAANLAELRDLTLGEVEVPDGYALPFYFYDEFMKHNGLYATVDGLLADEAFKAGIGERDARLSRLRRSIRDGEFPDALRAEIGDLRDEFPDTTSIRCRSSTNNEDLPAFNGAGLYDSVTHNPDEGHLEKSIKQVFASLWNLRAFEAREFHRVDHRAAAMGVLLHPNFSGELANGVAASENVFITVGGPADAYYVNAQFGEELVTNPGGHLPEELLLSKDADFTVSVVRRSSLAEDGAAVLSDEHIATLHAALGTIDSRFATLHNVVDGTDFAIEIEFKVTAADAVAIKQVRPWVYD